MCQMCDGKSREQVRRQLLARIAEHDYTMVGVKQEWPRDRSWVAPGFVYSVGLWSFHRVPELIVVGAPDQHGVELIERYAKLTKAGKRFKPGGPYPDFAPGAGMMLERVAPSLYPTWFASAYDLYPDGEFPAMQLLWPDKDGTWPWELRWAKRNVPQPVLTMSGRPNSWSPDIAVTARRRRPAG